MKIHVIKSFSLLTLIPIEIPEKDKLKLSSICDHWIINDRTLPRLSGKTWLKLVEYI